MKMPQWPQFNTEEIEKVKEIMLSGKVNYWSGNEGISFEKSLLNGAQLNMLFV